MKRGKCQNHMAVKYARFQSPIPHLPPREQSMDLTCSEALGEDVGVTCGRVQNCRPRAPVRMVQDGSCQTTLLQRKDSRGWQLGQTGVYDRAHGRSTQLLEAVDKMKQEEGAVTLTATASAAGRNRVNEEETERNHQTGTGNTKDSIAGNIDCAIKVAHRCVHVGVGGGQMGAS